MFSTATHKSPKSCGAMLRIDSDLFSTIETHQLENRFHHNTNNEEEEEEEENIPPWSLQLSPREKYIAKMALKSRMFIVVVGAVASTFVGRYDSSSSLLSSHYYPPALLCPSNWDAAFNVKIALEHGYTYEQSHAFFPLFPLVMSLCRNILWYVTSQTYEQNDLVFMGLVGGAMNNALFVLAAVLFCRLSVLVFEQQPKQQQNRRRLAMRASILFCYNPASIFFSVAYSESLFAVFALAGMLLLNNKRNEGVVSFKLRLAASLLFALATLTRSNGSLLGIFSLYAAWRAFDRKRPITHVLQLAVVGTLHAIALLAVLGYGYFAYCLTDNDARPWCNSWLPNIYSFVQKEYWNLGLFTYYEAKQIPNFLLASPAIAISVGAMSRFKIDKAVVPLPFYAQMLASLCIALSVMHVQVFTRMVCSSSPLFFWYAADLTQRKSGISYFVLLYFSFYMLLGASMFCAYFPWT